MSDEEKKKKRKFIPLNERWSLDKYTPETIIIIRDGVEKTLEELQKEAEDDAS